MNPTSTWTATGIIVGALLTVAGRAAWVYAKARIEKFAADASDRALADYKAEHDKTLAALEAEHQKRLKEHGLYREKRHLVYGKLYKRVSIAADNYGAMLGFTMGPDFAKYEREDVDAYFERNTVPALSRRPIEAAFAAGNAESAKQLLDKLDDRLRRHRALVSFNRARGVERVGDLYLSDAVRHQMTTVRSTIARFSVALEREYGFDPEALEKKEAMQKAVDDLFAIMRGEMDQ